MFMSLYEIAYSVQKCFMQYISHYFLFGASFLYAQKVTIISWMVLVVFMYITLRRSGVTLCTMLSLGNEGIYDEIGSDKVPQWL